jgi:hypothetical protein
LAGAYNANVFKHFDKICTLSKLFNINQRAWALVFHAVCCVLFFCRKTIH